MTGKIYRKITVVAAVLALAVVAAPAALADKPENTSQGKSAQAKPEQVTAQKAWDVKVSRGMTTLAELNGALTWKAFKPAKLAEGTLAFPVSEGKLKLTRDDQTQAVTGALGYIRHVGAFSLTANEKSLKARNLLVRFTKEDGVKVLGRVKGKLVLLGTITDATLSTAMDGKQFKVENGNFVVSDRLANLFGLAIGAVAAYDVDVVTRIIPTGASSS